MKNGAVAVIEKPYRNDDLADAVRKAMDQNTHMLQSLAERKD